MVAWRTGDRDKGEVALRYMYLMDRARSSRPSAGTPSDYRIRKDKGLPTGPTLGNPEQYFGLLPW